MKKITDYETLENSGATEQEKIIVRKYLKELFELYSIDTIKDIGSIYIIENEKELNDYRAFGMYEPIKNDNIEFIDKIFISRNSRELNYVLCCCNIYTDYAIYLLLAKNILSAEKLNIFYQVKYITNKYIDLGGF